MMRRGQVTAFIIIGLLVLAGVMFFLLFQEATTKEFPVDITQYTITNDLDPVQTYIESCLFELGKEPVTQLGLQGGTTKSIEYTVHRNQRINYLCYQEAENGCINKLLLRQDMERELENILVATIESCVDLDIFEEQGFAIQKQEKDATVRISDENVDITFHWPLTFTKDNFTASIDTFQIDYNSPLGELYDYSLFILNEENTNGGFDVAQRSSEDTNVRIFREKPYPDTIYQLVKDDFIFNFAIQGKDSVGPPGKDYFFTDETEYGCCYNTQDGMCFKNVPEELCRFRDGVYDPSSSCTCDSTIELSNDCEDGSCLDCGEYAHGTSWCVYDPSPEGGLVGSRHSVDYCFNGTILTDTCRDYREEICRQSDTSATCVPNRWQDCSLCDTEECCLNAELRDCSFIESMCVPLVSPGTKFWLGADNALCAPASTRLMCNGDSCEDSLSAQNTLCTQLSDCGSDYNVYLKPSYDGFFNTKKLSVIRKLPSEAPPLPLLNSTLQHYVAFPSTSVNQFIELISWQLNRIGTLSSFNPYQDVLNETAEDLALCSLWQAPYGGDCSLCGSQGTCSEYQCRALGSNCYFSYSKATGMPTCSARGEDDRTPPTITFSALDLEGYDAKEVRLVNMNGYEIMPYLSPYSALTLEIQTDELTQCKLDYLPHQNFASAPQFWFGDASFSTHHNITLRVPPTLRLPQNVRDVLGLTSSDNLLALVTGSARPGGPLPLADFFVTTFTKLMDSLQDILPQAASASEKILSDYELGKYYLFVQCSDEAGNSNAEQLFIRFGIQDARFDNSTSEVLGFIPQNGSSIAANETNTTVRMYVNEPSDCKYDSSDVSFDDMDSYFVCERSQYSYGSSFGGSYMCETVLDVLQTSTFYIRCKDKPVEEERYTILIRKENETGVTGLSDSPFAEVTPDNQIHVSSHVLDLPLQFSVSSSVVNVTVYNDRFNQCSILRNGTRTPLPCKLSSNSTRGIYACEGSLALTEDITRLPIICQSEVLPNPVVNEESFVYSLSISEGLYILDTKPTGEVISSQPLLEVTTSGSEDVECFYLSENGYEAMDAVTGTSFQTQLSDVEQGDNEFSIRCSDGYGNEVEGTIFFYVS